MANVKRQIFYSFHYENDVMRVSQIRNIGVIEGNTPVSDNDWEQVKKGGDDAIKRWIDNNMSGRSCVVVLVGEKTAYRKWIKYEIEKAWNDGKGVVGIYIHRIKCARSIRSGGNGYCNKGSNPFDEFKLTFNNGGSKKLSQIVECYNPDPYDAYNDIAVNLEQLVENAIAIRNDY